MDYLVQRKSKGIERNQTHSLIRSCWIIVVICRRMTKNSLCVFFLLTTSILFSQDLLQDGVPLPMIGSSQLQRVQPRLIQTRMCIFTPSRATRFDFLVHFSKRVPSTLYTFFRYRTVELHGKITAKEGPHWSFLVGQHGLLLHLHQPQRFIVTPIWASCSHVAIVI